MVADNLTKTQQETKELLHGLRSIKNTKKNIHKLTKDLIKISILRFYGDRSPVLF